ncbi:hypothetical protein OH77DRAFT_394451 [Trametes cingulata]|nr:hypothetical protein OH77DRAFT_394451 [Trametes cingulata]
MAAVPLNGCSLHCHVPGSTPMDGGGYRQWSRLSGSAFLVVYSGPMQGFFRSLVPPCTASGIAFTILPISGYWRNMSMQPPRSKENAYKGRRSCALSTSYEFRCLCPKPLRLGGRGSCAQVARCLPHSRPPACESRRCTGPSSTVVSSYRPTLLI